MTPEGGRLVGTWWLNADGRQAVDLVHGHKLRVVGGTGRGFIMMYPAGSTTEITLAGLDTTAAAVEFMLHRILIPLRHHMMAATAHVMVD